MDFALVSTAAAEFVVSPPTDEICTGWQGTLDVPHHAAAAAGGVWEATGPRRVGHQVCWRIAGAELELSETCLLPGVSIAGGELRLRFACGLLPPLGFVQLPDDSLLLSAAMHAPSGGVFVYQMRFELRADDALLHGAVVRRPSWFSAQYPALSTPEPVGASLGVALVAAFGTTAEPAGPRAYRTTMIIGGEAAHAVHVTLTSDRATDIRAASTDLRADRSVRGRAMEHTRAPDLTPFARTSPPPLR